MKTSNDLRRLVRRSRRVAGKILTKGRRLSDLMVKPSEADLLIDRMRETAKATPGLEGKVVVITGSTKGIGRAVADGFAVRGARLVINGRSVDGVEAAVGDIRRLGGIASGVAADVGTGAGAKTLLAGALAAFGRVDILINNAGMAGPTGIPLWRVEGHDAEDVIRTNLFGPFACASTFVDWMLANGVQGRIINVSSGAGTNAQPKMGLYGVSKFGLEGLTKYLAADLDHAGITVVTVQPGSILTDMTKGVFGWDRAQELPDAEAVVPTFAFAATAPACHVHGRSISVNRHLGDEFAEARLAGPAAAVRPFRFQPLMRQGIPVSRLDPSLAIYDRAESQFGAAPAVSAAIAAWSARAPAERYPDPRYPRLREALAREHDLPVDWFAFGNGSSELISRIINLFVRPGERGISNDPGWFGFGALAARVGMDGVRVPFITKGPANRAHHNLKGVLEAIDGRTRLIYLISPSNPEGVPLRHVDFQEFLQRVPPNVAVIVDEAYVEYAADGEMLRTAELVKETDRMLIGLRTFSKFYGLAGLRVGYGFARPEVIDLIERLELPFNISSVAETAALAALAATEFRARTSSSIQGERGKIEKRFREMGLDYIPSQSGMILVERPTGDLLEIYEHFQDNGVFLSQGSFFDDKYMLFPVGTADQNEKNLALLHARVR